MVKSKSQIHSGEGKFLLLSRGGDEKRELVNYTRKELGTAAEVLLLLPHLKTMRHTRNRK